MNRIRCLTILFASMLISACTSGIEPDPPGWDGAAWMSRLDDDTPLTCVSIPGAHDAATAGVTAWPQWTRAQELDIEALWNSGVRAFDLRPALVNGVMGIYHDKYSTHVTLKEALLILSHALSRHPGEFAIVLIRHEREADGDNPDWAPAFYKILESHSDRVVAWRPDLTVGALRGKILVLSRNSYEGGPVGGYVEGWSHGKELLDQQAASIIGPDGVKGPLWVQDYYDPDDVETKWDAVRHLLDATAASRPLVINHTSGYLGNLPNYRKLAREINPLAAEHIRQLSAPVGIIMTDFAGVDTSKGIRVCGRELVRAVIENNF